MPIYEYRCENDHLSDVIQRMAEAPLTACPVCGAPAQRVMHAPAVHFKGSGFYNTDYGTKKRSRELKEAGEGTGKYDAGDRDKSSEKKDGDGAKPEKKTSESSTTSSGSGSGGETSSTGKTKAGSKSSE